MRNSYLRWHLVAMVATVASFAGGCSCRGSRAVSQAKGDPNFVNTKGDKSLSIVDDQGKTAPKGKTVTVDFGPTLVNEDQPSQKVLTITNDGVATVQILRLDKAAGFDSDDFKVPAPTQVQQTIEPGHNGTVQISFAPSKAGDFASDFTLATDADDSTGHPLTVHLKGQGVSNGCVLAPADKLDFGNVKLNASVTQTLVVQNTTPIDWDFTFNGITGADAALFTTTLQVGNVTVKAHDTLSIPVTFTANHKDVAAAELQFSSPADMCAPEPFDLRANGVDSLITATPDPLDFGFVDPGVTWGSVSKTVSLTNIGSSPIALSSAQLCDGQYGGAYSPNCGPVSEFSASADGSQGSTSDLLGGFTLAAGESKRLTLYFKPARLHQATAYVQYHLADGTGAPLATQPDFGFDLQGTGGGPKIQVQPTQLNYGTVALGAPQSRNVIITNVGSSPSGQAGAQLQITGLTISHDANTADGEFSVDASVSLPASLAATQRLAVPVKFDPASAGPKAATLTITSNDPVNPTVTVSLQADGEQLPPCNYTVSPTTLNFGNVNAGRNRVLDFKVTNTGTTDCLISSLDLGGDTTSPPYSIIGGAIASQTLAGGASLDVQVKFAPVDQTAVQNGSVVFYTSSTTAPSATVALNGGSAQGCILVTPDDLDFGVVAPGCASREQTFTVYNVCSTVQHLTGLDFLPDANGLCPDQGAGATCPFRITAAPTLPATLAAGASTDFKIKYQPAGVQTDAVSVSVQTQELANPYIVTLKGRGDPNATQTDTYTQDAQPKVDVLLIIDDSGSMYDKQQALAQNFQSFIQFAVNQQVDYHIAVTSTTTDKDGYSSCAVNSDPNNGSIAPCGLFAPSDGSRPRVLTNTTPNLEQIFQQNVNLGTNGSGNEMGLEAAYEALSAPNITGPNANFLRDEANLAAVVVTDTADSSPQPYDFYKNFLINIKGFSRANAFSFSAVVPTQPTPPPTTWNCDYDSEAGTNFNYANLAQDTNGVVQEICTDDWATALRQLGQSAFGYRTRFFLTETPDLTYSIDVSIDGTPYPATGTNGSTRWTYNSTANAIDFAPLAVPEPGSTLTITYHVLCYTP